MVFYKQPWDHKPPIAKILNPSNTHRKTSWIYDNQLIYLTIMIYGQIYTMVL